jgi:hypothetical protein
MLTKTKAAFAKGDILAISTFVDSFNGLNFFQLASVAVVIVFLTYFFVDDLFLVLYNFLPNFFQNIRGFFISAERTFYNTVVFDFMVGPLSKTL